MCAENKKLYQVKFFVLLVLILLCSKALLCESGSTLLQVLILLDISIGQGEEL